MEIFLFLCSAGYQFLCNYMHVLQKISMEYAKQVGIVGAIVNL